MDFNKIIHSMLFILVTGQNVASLILQTGDVVVNLQDSSIILNCTYQKDEQEFISDGGINWQKQIGGTFKDIAIFSPPGSALKPFIDSDMHPLYNSRTELIATNTSLSAVMIIKNPVCSDEGTYRCMIEYIYNNFIEKKTSSSVVSFNANALEPYEFDVLPNEVIENQSLSLTCSADVGSPRGYVQIWKTAEYSNTPELIYTSNFTNNKTDKCTEFINVTTTYTVTRDDNGAQFRCSSKNNLTQGTGPTKESKKIAVIYGPFDTNIEASFSNSRAFVGEYINMKCSSCGNPNPNYTWKFNSTEIVNNAKYNFSANKSGLSFTITNITDSGIYHCVASINFKGKWFFSSSYVTFTVQEKRDGASPVEIETCIENSCSAFQNCVLKSNRAFCSINIWIVIAIVFICVTLICGTATIILLTKTHRKKTSPNTNDMDMGGYLSPVGEANRSSYESLGQQSTVHVYSTMQNRDLLGHGSNYESLGQQGTVHVYSTMQNNDLFGHG